MSGLFYNASPFYVS